jgi:hypothetical protein
MISDSDSILAFWLEPKPTTPAENDVAWRKWFEEHDYLTYLKAVGQWL